MREELDKGGFLVWQQDGQHSKKLALGVGTVIPSSQTRVYEINFHKLFDGTSLSIVQSGDNVVTKTAGE